MNRTYFINRVKQSLFGGKISKTQIGGLLILIDFRDKHHVTLSDEKMAYVLATAKLETAHTLQPVKEYGSNAYFFRMYDPRGSRPQIAARLGNGRSGDGALYCGRGYAQITGRANYRKFGIEATPEDALKPDIAARIIFEGMINGTFTGKRLSDYISDSKKDFVGARKIINGTDRANLIAGYATAFLDAIKQAKEKSAPAVPAPDDDMASARPAPEPATGEPEDQATGKALTKSTTAGAATVAGAAGAAGPVVEAVKQVQEAAEAGKGIWDVAASVGPWVLLVLIIVGAAGYIIWERRRRSREEGV